MVDFSRHTHIALDLDETLASVFAGMLEIAHAKGLLSNIATMDEIYDHDLGIISNREITRADAISIWDDLALTWHHPEVVQVIEHAKDGVKELLNLGKKIFIITARNEKNKKEVTYEWISYHFPEISLDQIHFVNHYLEDARPKSSVCKELGVTLLIDDHHENALDMAENGIECILLEKPWNRTKEINHPLIHRVKNWKEIIACLHSSIDKDLRVIGS